MSSRNINLIICIWSLLFSNDFTSIHVSPFILSHGMIQYHLYCFISAWYYQHSIILSNCLEYIPISPFWGVIYLFSVGQSSIISWWNPAVILRPNLPRWHLPARSWFTTPVVHHFFSDIYHKPTLSLETNLANLGINHQSHVLCGLTHHLTVAYRTVKHRKWSGSPRKPRSRPRGWDIGQTSIRPAASQDPSWCRTKVVPQKSDVNVGL